MVNEHIMEYVNNPKKRNQLTFWLVLLCVLIPFLFKLVGLHERFSSQASIVATTVLLSMCTAVNFREIGTKNRVLCLIVNMVCLLVTVITVGALGVSLIHINTLLALWLFNNVVFCRKQGAVIHLAMAVMIGLWLTTLNYTYIKNAYVTELNDMYVNPCTVAIMTLACYYHLLLFMECTPIKNKWLKYAVLVISTVVALHLILESVCRATLLALIAFGGLVVFRKFMIKYYRPILICAMIFVLLFPFAYIFLAQVSDGWEFFGKNFFTGRQVVWQSVLESIAEHPVFGAGSGDDIALKDRFMGDAHTLFLGIWKYIGIVPMITMMCVIPQGKNMKQISRNNQLGKLMFLTCLIISTVETLLNGAEYYIFYLTLLITVEKDKSVEENDDTQENSLLLVWRQFLAGIGKKVH